MTNINEPCQTYIYENTSNRRHTLDAVLWRSQHLLFVVSFAALSLASSSHIYTGFRFGRLVLSIGTGWCVSEFATLSRCSMGTQICQCGWCVERDCGNHLAYRISVSATGDWHLLFFGYYFSRAVVFATTRVSRLTRAGAHADCPLSLWMV